MGIFKGVRLLQPGAVFKGEQGKGILTSLSAGFIANILVMLGEKKWGMDVATSAAVFGLGVGNIIGYIADIMFAKENFLIKGVLHQYGLGQLALKFKWLLNSFISKTFFRFWIIVFIDMILTLTLVDYLAKYMDENKWFTKVKYRNSLIVFFISITTFLLYVNPLRFNWAYNINENPMMNIMILMWLALSILIFVSTRRQTLVMKNFNMSSLLSESEEKEAQVQEQTDPQVAQQEPVRAQVQEQTDLQVVQQEPVQAQVLELTPPQVVQQEPVFVVQPLEQQVAQQTTQQAVQQVVQQVQPHQQAQYNNLHTNFQNIL